MNFELEELSRLIRVQVLKIAGTDGGGHLGGTFSCVDILANLFSNNNFNFGFNNEMSSSRDRFILSKGHACLAYYSFLFYKGKLTQNQLESFGRNGGLGAQLDTSVPFVDWNTGSLGHSIGICAGIAMASKLESNSFKAVTLIGDSELSEGSSWEGIAFCGDRKLSNVIVIVDRNRLTVTSRIDNDAIYNQLELKMRAFGWEFIEVDGHNHYELGQSFQVAAESKLPTLILANTVKGKGVTFMEDNPIWHHTRPTEAQFMAALNQLENTSKES
jgi:transketolase